MNDSYTLPLTGTPFSAAYLSKYNKTNITTNDKSTMRIFIYITLTNFGAFAAEDDEPPIITREIDILKCRIHIFGRGHPLSKGIQYYQFIDSK